MTHAAGVSDVGVKQLNVWLIADPVHCGQHCGRCCCQDVHFEQRWYHKAAGGLLGESSSLCICVKLLKTVICSGERGLVMLSA